MSAPRFSIRTLLVAISYLALVLVALRSGSLYWADFMFTSSIAIVLVATLAAIFIRDERRIFWQGFALVGWIYMLLAFGPWTEGNLRSNLATHHMLEKIQRWLAPIQAARFAEPGFNVQPDNEYRYRIGPNHYFGIFEGGCWQATQRSGHSVWAIILGTIGGFVAVNFSKFNTVRSFPNRTNTNIA